MDDEALSQFQAVTGSDLAKAQQYLQISDNDVGRAIELFFETGGVDLLNDAPSTTSAPQASSSRSVPPDQDVIQIDSDDEELETTGAAGTGATSGHSVEDDEAMARRLQEEMYGGGGSSGGAAAGGVDAEGYRAPMARTTETLVGGPGAYDYNLDDPDDRHAALLQQLRAREQARLGARRRGGPGAGIFNQQQPGASIWNEDGATHEARHAALARSTGGASQQSAKANQLAEMFRPPFELMAHMDFEGARAEGKEEQKWLLINIQDTSIFDCQILNRDLWKDDGIRETIKENFIFLQFNKDDPAGDRYTQYYFKDRDVQDSYPHIAIVDPRTGEQVKVWSGPPAPKPMEFLMQLHEFLDRYSLDVTAKNPVARRKPAEKKNSQLDRMTEDEQLAWALKNSVDGGATDEAGKEVDPDELTRSIADMRDQGKGKDKEDTAMTNADETETAEPSRFAAISAANPHTEPSATPNSTRIQFRHSGGRIIRRFLVEDSVRTLFEWLKADPPDGKQGQDFELVSMGKNLIDSLDQTIEEAGLKNGTVMIEFIEA